MPHSQTLHFPTNFSPDLVYFTFIPSHTHSLFTLPQFIYSLIRITIFFLIFIQNVKANTVYLHTYDYNENDLNRPMNKNESARNYIQFSFVIVCKIAETNFTKRAVKGGVINWTSAYIQAVATFSSRYANFSNTTEVLWRRVLNQLHNVN